MQAVRRANTRVGQAPATDVGTTGREMLAAHGHHRLRSPHARPSQRRAPFPTFRHSCVPSVIPAPPPSFLRPLRHSCAPFVIPAEAGIQAICAGQGLSQCSTAPDHPRGSGGPSAGWRLVARLGGRMDSCLRRNDGQGGCDGGGGGMTEGRVTQMPPHDGGRWDPTCSEDAGQRPPRVETALNVERAPPRPRIAARRRRRSAAPRSRGCASGPPATDRG